LLSLVACSRIGGVPLPIRIRREAGAIKVRDEKGQHRVSLRSEAPSEGRGTRVQGSVERWSPAALPEGVHEHCSLVVKNTVEKVVTGESVGQKRLLVEASRHENFPYTLTGVWAIPARQAYRAVVGSCESEFQQHVAACEACTPAADKGVRRAVSRLLSETVKGCVHEFAVAWAEKHKEEVAAAQQQQGRKSIWKKSLPKEVMERIYLTDQNAMMEGLNARIGNVENADALRMQQVYDAFKPYTEGKELPPGTTPQIMRFLVVSAGTPGLWQRMDEFDPRLGDVLLGYYANGVSLRKLAGTIEGAHHSTQVQRLLNEGLHWLFTELPEAPALPLDKHQAFDLDEMLGTRRDRQRAAGEKRAAGNHTSEWGRRTAARRWWETESADIASS
jgi:hypothetical protein